MVQKRKDGAGRRRRYKDRKRGKEGRRDGEREKKRKLIFSVGLNYSVMVGESLNRCLKFQKMARTQLALPGK